MPTLPARRAPSRRHRSAARAPRGVDTGERRDKRDASVAFGCGERLVDFCSGLPVAITRLRRAAPAASRSSGRTPTIKAAYVRPSRTIVTVEIALRTSFCAVPALRRVEPATASGPTTTRLVLDLRGARAGDGDYCDADAPAIARLGARPACTASSRWR